MPSINCTDIEQLLRNAAESRQIADLRAVSAHVAECDACRELVHDETSLDAIVAAWKQSLPAADLVDRALLGWQSVATHQPQLGSVIAAAPDRRGRSSRLAWIAATVAGILLAVFIGSRVWRGENFAGTEFVNHRPSPADVVDGDPKVAATDPAEPARGADVVKQAYLALANDAASAVSAGSVLLPAGVDMPAAGTTEESPSWLDDMSRELKPVATKLGMTFEILIDSLPQEDSAAT